MAKRNLTFLGGKGVLIRFGVKKAIWHRFLDVRFPFRVSKEVLEKCWVSTVRFPLANSRVSLLPRDEQNVANRVRCFQKIALNCSETACSLGGLVKTFEVAKENPTTLSLSAFCKISFGLGVCKKRFFEVFCWCAFSVPRFRGVSGKVSVLTVRR